MYHTKYNIKFLFSLAYIGEIIYDLTIKYFRGIETYVPTNKKNCVFPNHEKELNIEIFNDFNFKYFVMISSFY